MPRYCVTKVTRIHSLDLKTNLTIISWQSIELMWRYFPQNQNGQPHVGARINKVIRMHIVKNVNACTKFHGNLSRSCWDISLRTKNVNLLVRGKVAFSTVEVRLFHWIRENFVPMALWEIRWYIALCNSSQLTGSTDKGIVNTFSIPLGGGGCLFNDTAVQLLFVCTK